MVPARTRDVTIPRVKRNKSSGVAPISPSTEKHHVEGYCSAKFRRISRGSIRADATAFKSRASTTFSIFSSWIFLTAVEIFSFHSSVEIVPLLHVYVGAFRKSGFSRRDGCVSSPIHVIQDFPPFIPTITLGMMRTESSVSEYEKDVKSIGPVPVI